MKAIVIGSGLVPADAYTQAGAKACPQAISCTNENGTWEQRGIGFVRNHSAPVQIPAPNRLHAGRHLSRMAAALLASLLLVAGCKSLSATEVDKARKSPDALVAAVTEAYRSGDVKAFAQLAMSPGEIKKMMSQLTLPENARRESMESKQAFLHEMQDSLRTVLMLPQVDWKTASDPHFFAARKPVELAPGYKLCLGRLEVMASGKRLSQPFSIMEQGAGQFYIADFGPFTVQE